MHLSTYSYTNTNTYDNNVIDTLIHIYGIYTRCYYYYDFMVYGGEF